MRRKQKKWVAAALAAAVCVTIAGCGRGGRDAFGEETPAGTVEKPDMINGFEEAVFEKFNSPAEENGLDGTPIYIEGIVETKVTAKKVLAFTLKQDDGNYWIVSVTDRPKKDKKIVDDIIDKEVRVFGGYMGYSEAYKMPGLALAGEGGKITVKNGKDGYQKVWDFNTYWSERAESQEESSKIVESEPQETEMAENTETPDFSPDIPIGQQNALKSALQYLTHSSFSRDGLIGQLGYEGYTNEESTYAVDNCGADWNEQALKSANSYLSHSSFSHQGLIDQLVYEGFTEEQAAYGADNCGADWNEQAAKSAEQYLSHSSFSREGLIEQLQYEGFTIEQATYGVDANGY